MFHQILGINVITYTMKDKHFFMLPSKNCYYYYSILRILKYSQSYNLSRLSLLIATFQFLDWVEYVLTKFKLKFFKLFILHNSHH